MFKIIPNPTFTANVKLTVPGQAEPAVVEIEFRHKGKAAYKLWLENADGKTDQVFLGEVIVNIPMADKDGKELPYTEKRLGMMLDAYPASGIEILAAYSTGLMESRAKNSGGSLVA